MLRIKPTLILVTFSLIYIAHLSVTESKEMIQHKTSNTRRLLNGALKDSGIRFLKSMKNDDKSKAKSKVKEKVYIPILNVFYFTSRSIIGDKYYNLRSFRKYTYKLSKIKQPATDFNEYYNPFTRKTYGVLYAYYHIPQINVDGWYSPLYKKMYFDGYGYNFYYGNYGYYEYSIVPTNYFPY